MFKSTQISIFLLLAFSCNQLFSANPYLSHESLLAQSVVQPLDACDDAKQAVSKAIGERSEIWGRLRTSKKQISDLNGEITGINKTIRDLQKKLNTLLDTIGDLKKDKKALEAQFQEYKELYESMQEEREDVVEQIRQAPTAEEKKALYARLVNLDEGLEALRVEGRLLRTKIEQKEKEIADKQKEIDKQRKAINDKKKLRAEKYEKIGKARENRNGIRQEINDKNAEIGSLRAAMRTACSNAKSIGLGNTQVANQTIKDENIGLQAENAEWQFVGSKSKLTRNIQTVADLNNTKISRDVKDSISQLQVTPNPTNGNFNISLTTPVEGDLILTIHDMQGKLVHQLLTSISSGRYQRQIELPSNLSNGLYYVNTVIGEIQINKKIYLQR